MTLSHEPRRVLFLTKMSKMQFLLALLTSRREATFLDPLRKLATHLGPGPQTPTTWCVQSLCGFCHRLLREATPGRGQ